jgi:plasmid maintenance system antidote protein VapI
MSGKQSWEELLREACRAWPESLYALAKQSGVDEGQLRRFVAGQQSIGIATAEKIGRVLGAELIVPKAKKRPAGG